MATVLALGLDPVFVPLPDSPELTPAIVRAFIDSQLERVRARGHHLNSTPADTAEAVERWA